MDKISSSVGEYHPMVHTVLDILWMLEMTDVTEKKNHRQFTVAFSVIGSKDFPVPLHVHVSLPLQPRLKFNKLRIVSVHHSKALRQSLV